jgi:hypothetical protein
MSEDSSKMSEMIESQAMSYHVLGGVLRESTLVRRVSDVSNKEVKLATSGDAETSARFGHTSI